MANALIGSALMTLDLKKGMLGAKIKKDIAEAEVSARSSGMSIGNALASGLRIAAIAAVGLTTVLAGVSVVSVKMAADFQQKMTLVRTQAGDTTDDLNSLTRSVLAMAPKVGTGPDQLADMLYHVTSAGFRGATALDMVYNAARLMKVGMGDADSTSQAMVGTMAAFEHQGMTASMAVAQLNAIVGTGDMRFEQLAKAISTGVLPSAATFGLTLKDVGAALATLTDNVTPADEAASRLRMTFSLLGAGSGAANKQLAKIGLSSLKLNEDMHKPNGLLVALEDIRTHLAKTFGPAAVDGLNHYSEILRTKGAAAADAYAAKAGGAAQIISHAFGGGKSGGTIMTLLSEFDRFKSKYGAITQGANDFGAAWTKTTQNFNFVKDQILAGLSALGIKIGLALLPSVTKFGSMIATRVLPALQSLFDWIQTKLVPAIQKFAAFIGPKLAPVIADVAQHFQDLTVPLKGIFDDLGKLWPVPLEPIAALIGGALVLGIKMAADTLIILATMVLRLIDGLLKLAIGIKAAISRFVDWVKAHKDVTDKAKGLFDIIGKIIDALSKIGGPIGTAIGWLGKLGDAGKAAGDLLGGLNPFQRHSPSLVDNVRTGTALISQQYAALTSQLGRHTKKATDQLAAHHRHVAKLSDAYKQLHQRAAMAHQAAARPYGSGSSTTSSSAASGAGYPAGSGGLAELPLRAHVRIVIDKKVLAECVEDTVAVRAAY